MQSANYSPPERSSFPDLMKVINGEFTAIQYYQHLANLAPNETIKQRILEIRADEEAHFKQFVHLFVCLMGYYPTPQITENMPTDFKSGVLHSFFDEQQTNEFYRHIATSCPEPVIKHLFFETAADEQNHAVWFLYFLTSS